MLTRSQFERIAFQLISDRNYQALIRHDAEQRKRIKELEFLRKQTTVLEADPERQIPGVKVNGSR